MKINEILTEEWSQKYKSSINCSHPKGFSQKAHCAGKKKHNESVEMEMVCEDCGMCQTHGNLNEIKKGQKDSNGYTRCWPGKHAEGTKKGKNGGQVRNCVPNESIEESEGKRCMQCGMKNCKCPGDSCKCKPIAGWVPNKGFRKAMDEAANAAQQAAIAVNMKKHHQKPKSQVTELAPGAGGGDGGNYFRELASAWYNGAYDSGSLQKGIKTNQDIERLLQRGIVAPDGKTRKYNIDYNSDFDGVIIFSDDYYEHGDHDDTDSRTGKPFGPYDYMEFSDDDLSEGVYESAELAEEFDLIESIINRLAEHNGVDAEVIWEDLETLTEDELYAFAVTSEPIMESQDVAEGSELKQAKRRYNQAAKDANTDQVGAGKKIDTMKKSLRQKDLGKEQGMTESEAWQKANNRDKTDGMSRKAVNTYRREHPGSKLQTAVTTKPSKLKRGSKASKRRSSYCSRSRGQMKMHSISCSKTPDKAICKARRRWNC